MLSYGNPVAFHNSSLQAWNRPQRVGSSVKGCLLKYRLIKHIRGVSRNNVYQPARNFRPTENAIALHLLLFLPCLLSAFTYSCFYLLSTFLTFLFYLLASPSVFSTTSLSAQFIASLFSLSFSLCFFFFCLLPSLLYVQVLFHFTTIFIFALTSFRPFHLRCDINECRAWKLSPLTLTRTSREFFHKRRSGTLFYVVERCLAHLRCFSDCNREPEKFDFQQRK